MLYSGGGSDGGSRGGGSDRGSGGGGSGLMSGGRRGVVVERKRCVA